ncbi:MAG: metallophosphoesterase [Oscillospiraceae bacterium]|nr:metallophosphoesterase [Oscillospiraceae bacterium]
MATHLQQLQQSGVQVLVLAGNHDVGGAGGDYSGEEITLVDGTTPELFRELYAPFGWDQAVSRDEHSMSYIYEATDKLRILMLDTNVSGKGFVMAGTLQWLEQELAYAQKHGIKVIGVSHQNLYAHNELLSFGYQLYNADIVTPLYEEYGVKANFSGHIHVQSIVRDKAVPEVVTASMSVMPAAYGVLQYTGKDFSYTTAATDVAAWAAAEGIADENLLNYATYCRWYFEECSREKTRRQFAESGIDAAEIELMADTFARINSAYFSGEGADAEAHAAGLALWQQHGQGGFSLAYFDTMLAAAANDALTLHFG